MAYVAIRTTEASAMTAKAQEPVSSENDDAVLDAINHLVTVLDEIGQHRDRIAERARHISGRRAKQVPYSVIVPEEVRPLIVERARESLNDLVEAAGRLQRAEARALYDEGLTMEAIGSLFGITRQRVADLLR
jgi:hypothetical protein